MEKTQKTLPKTKDMEEALARLENVKANYNQTYLDALNEYDPLVAKAQQLLELLVQKYVEVAKLNEMQLYKVMQSVGMEELSLLAVGIRKV